MENPKFVLKKTEDGQFHFTLQAKNGETIVQSETYTTKKNAKNGIESVVESIMIINVKTEYKHENRIEDLTKE